MDFETALTNWLNGAQEKINQHYIQEFHNLSVPNLVLERGQKRIRVVREEPGSRSAFAFIDIETGDVLKAASWKAPAKHARGNIYDESGGLKYVSAYGPAYLRG